MDLHCAIMWSKLSLGTCLDYSWQLIGMLDHLNHHGIIHRDIKPSNILVVNTRIVLADFGMSRTAGTTKNHSECNTCESSQSSQSSSLTDPAQPPMTDGKFLCTLYYKPPEFALRCRHHTTAADTWSVGCVIAEMFLQTPLFGCASVKQLISRIITTIGLPDDTAQHYFQCRQEMAFPWTKVHHPIQGTAGETVGETVGGAAVDNSFENAFDNSGSVLMSKFKHRYPQLNTYQLRSLLKGMLRWHPDGRTTICQLVRHPFFNEIAKHNNTVNNPVKKPFKSISKPINRQPLYSYKSVIERVDAGNCTSGQLKSELRKLVRKVNITHHASVATGAPMAADTIPLNMLSLESTIDSLVQRGKQLNSKIRLLRKSGDMNEQYTELLHSRTLNNKSLQTYRRQLSKNKSKPTVTTAVLDGPTVTTAVLDGPTVTTAVLDGPTVTTAVLDGPTVTTAVLDGPTPTIPSTTIHENIAGLVDIISHLTASLKGLRKVNATNQPDYQTLINKRESYRKELNRLRYHAKRTH